MMLLRDDSGSWRRLGAWQWRWCAYRGHESRRLLAAVGVWLFGAIMFAALMREQPLAAAYAAAVWTLMALFVAVVVRIEVRRGD